jgi:hypothetical protein
MHAKDIPRVSYVDFLLKRVDRNVLTNDPWLLQALRSGFSYEDRKVMAEIILPTPATTPVQASRIPIPAAAPITTKSNMNIPGVVLPARVAKTLTHIGYTTSQLEDWIKSLSVPPMNDSDYIKSACRYLGKP